MCKILSCFHKKSCKSYRDMRPAPILTILPQYSSVAKRKKRCQILFKFVGEWNTKSFF